MDSEKRAWLVFGLAALALTVLPVTGCVISQNILLRDMVISGADSQKAACAIHGGERNCFIANSK